MHAYVNIALNNFMFQSLLSQGISLLKFIWTIQRNEVANVVSIPS